MNGTELSYPTYKRARQQEVFNKELTLSARQLFSKSKAGHMGAFLFADPAFIGDPLDGSKIWENLLQDQEEYYILNSETRLIKRCIQSVADQIQKPVSIIELGVGTDSAIDSKTIPTIRAFNKVSCYIPIDKSKEYVENAVNKLSKEFSSTQFIGYQADFYDTKIPYDALTTPVMLMYGLTLFNHEGHPDQGRPLKYIMKNMKKLREHIPNGYFIFTADTNQDKSSIENTYKNHSKFSLNLLNRIQRDCNTQGFNPDNFEFKVEWHPEASTLAHYYISKRTQSFVIDGQAFTVRAGEKFCYNNSYKLPLEDIIKISEAAGFEVQSVHSGENNRLQLLTLKAS